MNTLIRRGLVAASAVVGLAAPLAIVSVASTAQTAAAAAVNAQVCVQVSYNQGYGLTWAPMQGQSVSILLWIPGYGAYDSGYRVPVDRYGCAYFYVDTGYQWRVFVNFRAYGQLYQGGSNWLWGTSPRTNFGTVYTVPVRG